MNKKILLGTITLFIIGFSVSSFKNPKSVIAQSKEVKTSANSVQTLNESNDSSVNPILSSNKNEVLKSNLEQQRINLNSISSYDSSLAFKSTIENDTQLTTTELASYGYPDLIIQKGVPFKWVINVSAENLNSCNNEIVIDSLGISKVLEIGENIIEFTPAESGVIPYSCWMGMQNATIAVVDDINNINENEIQNQIEAIPLNGGCCG